MGFRMNSHEVNYITQLYPQEPWEAPFLKLLKERMPNLHREDRLWLSDCLERRRHLERTAMTISPPKHTATVESETWAASFWFRLNFIDRFIAHLRGVGPEPDVSGQALRKSVIRDD